MRKRDRAARSKTSETITTWLAKAIIGVQRRWASWMQRRTSGWGPRQQAQFLYVVLLVFGGFSTYLLLDTFRGKRNTTAPLDQQLVAPVMPSRERKQLREAPLVPTDTTVFKRFHAYIDSIKKSPDSLRLDSFLKARPHFLDSVTEAENLIRQFHH